MSFKIMDSKTLYINYPNIKKEDIEILQQWAKKQPHLPQIEEVQFIIILQSCYCKIEAAKQCIDRYFTIRTHNMNVFQHLPLDIALSTSSTVMGHFLEKPTAKNDAVFLVKLLDSKPQNFLFLNIARLVIAAATLAIHQMPSLEGFIMIFDIEGFTLSHVTRLDLSALKTIIEYAQKAAPIRIKGIHIINGLSFVNHIKTLLKPFLTNELFNMLLFHASMDSLHTYIPQEILPKEYGGALSDCVQLREAMLENIKTNFNFFSWHETQMVDETLRLDKTKHINSTFGIDGTFKKLSLD